MSKRNRYSKYNNKERSGWSWLPLLFVFAVLPAISYLHLYDAKLAEYSWFGSYGTASDLFLWGKATFFIILNAVMLVQLVYSGAKKGKLPKAGIYIPLLIYMALALLSSVISEYRAYSFSGTFEQFESVWVLLGYGVTAYYVFAMLQTERDVKWLMGALITGAVISCLIGLSQASGNNFWSTELGKVLRIPNKELRDSVDITSNVEDTRVYMSLYNPNYVGMYAALLIPVFAALAFPYKGDSRSNEQVAWRVGKKLLMFAGMILLCAALVKCTIGSGSKNGFLSLLAAFGVLVILLVIHYRRFWYILVPMLMVPFMAFSLVNQVMDERITNALESSLHAEPREYVLQDISFEENQVIMTLSGERLHIYLDESGKFELKDDAGQALGIQLDGTRYAVADERFNMVKIEIALDNAQMILGVTYGKTWYFKNQSGKIQYLSPANVWCTFETAESAVFTGKESVFSGRGYIWSRTIPLLKDYIILGSGADTFLLAFPNDDYVGKYNAGYYDTLITKPHNMYLQMAVQTGMLSVIAFVVFYCWYFFSSCRLYLRCRMNTFAARAGLGILAGTFGYMVSGLTNDSTVTVAPLFWGLMGVGIAINTHLLKEAAPQAAVNKAVAKNEPAADEQVAADRKKNKKKKR